MQTTLQGAIALKGNSNLFEKDGKVWANINWLRLWPKNPRVIDNKNLKKLEKQIKELGVYKPLVITPDGEILGGNQRFKVITELAKKDNRYEWVWVSVVEAWTDEERIKYAISDNFSAGEYTREKLQEIINLDQGNLFDGYEVSFEEKKSIQEFLDELAIPETELKFKTAKKALKELGITEETIKTLETMVVFNKNNEELPDVDLKGKITGQKIPMLFWFDDEIIFNQFSEIFKKLKDNYNTPKLIEITEKALDCKFPTTEDRLLQLLKAVELLNTQEKDFKEFSKSADSIIKKRATILQEIQRLLKGKFPDFGF